MCPRPCVAIIVNMGATSVPLLLLIVSLLVLTSCDDQEPSPTPTPTTETPEIAPSPTATATPRPAPVTLPTATATPPTPQLPPFQPSERPLRSTRLMVTDDALWAGHPASRTVTRLALPAGRRSWQTKLDCEPATLARANSRLYVACFDSGEVVVLDDRSGQILARSRVGSGPFGILAIPGRVYVTAAHEDSLAVLDGPSLTEVMRIATGRHPRGLALSGDRLYVGHLLDASVRTFNAETLEPLDAIQIGHQAAFAETLTIHSERARAYVPHQRQNLTNMARLFDSTVFPVVSVLDTEKLRPVRRELLALDTVDTPVSMPIASVLGPDGRRLYVVNAASDDISVIDLDNRIGVGHVAVGQNPRDVALSPDGKRLYTLNLVSDDVTVVDTHTLTVLKSLPLAEDPRPAVIQQGERIFSTSRPDGIAFDNWMACSSCHFDAGFDGRTWLGTTGGPRNTPILRGIGGTEPLHWSADRPDVQSFQKTFTGLMAGEGLSQMELDALAAYLNSLVPISSPLRDEVGSLTGEARQGATVFGSAGCAACHSPQRFTDRDLHDVGTGQAFHEHPSGSGTVAETMGSAFDTPSLRELWATAPYLHDGRAATLRDVLLTFNQEGLHGATAGLSESDLAALEAFLLALPLTPDEVADLFGQ